MTSKCLHGTWRKLSRASSCKVWRGESEFILTNRSISFHFPVIVLLEKTGVLLLLVCAKPRFGSSEQRLMKLQHFWKASLLIRSWGSLRSYQEIFQRNTVTMNVGISIWSADPLVWSEIPDGCKPLLLFLPEGFSVISNISLSLELILSFYHVRSGLINSRLHDWLLRNTFLWKMLRHWGVSKMWSWATHFLSPWAKSQGRTYFKRDKNM